MNDSRVKRLASPVGDLFVVADERGVLMCEFDCRDVPKEVARAAGPWSDDAMVDRVRDELAEYFRGERRQFTLPFVPLGTPFQQSVWQHLLAIPFGQTRSYAQQATAAGNLKAIRAVARANGGNFRGILIPCHRVIGSDGSLTGFGGGLPRKRWLLDHEQAVLGRAGENVADLFAAVATH